MTSSEQLVLFTLDEQRYGIPLAAVERVVRIVEITTLPKAPEFIRGVINVQGEIMPVVDLRRRFDLPERPLQLTDQLIILRCAKRSFALVSESLCEVRECTTPLRTATEEFNSEHHFLSGIAKLPDGLILLSNPDALFSPGEGAAIDELIGSEES